MNYANFFELKGKTIVGINDLEIGSGQVSIRTNDGNYELYHDQDCCEHVRIVKVIGNVNELIGEVIFAEEDSGANDPDWYNKPSNYAQLVQWYQDLEEQYPDYIEVFKANELYGTGQATGGYDLYYVRISNEIFYVPG